MQRVAALMGILSGSVSANVGVAAGDGAGPGSCGFVSPKAVLMNCASGANPVSVGIRSSDRCFRWRCRSRDFLHVAFLQSSPLFGLTCGWGSVVGRRVDGTGNMRIIALAGISPNELWIIALTGISPNVGV